MDTNDKATPAACVGSTPLFDSLFKNNTEAVKRDCDDGIIEWDIFLNVDHQGFCVAREMETLEQADWMRRQLALALESLIKSND